MGAGRKEGVEEVVVLVPNIGVCPFCLDEISFRRDYKSCQVGVVVVRRSSVVPQLCRGGRKTEMCKPVFAISVVVFCYCLTLAQALPNLTQVLSRVNLP